MKLFLFTLTIVFLGIVSPALLIKIATPWSLNVILPVWGVIFLVACIASWPWYKKQSGI